jgi:ATP-dependent Clp protease ATP-binding subunit ClpA
VFQFQIVQLHVLDMGLLQAGASVKGEFENRLKQVIQEVQSAAYPIILFIDEAHTLIGAGGQAGQNDAANLLKPALARGELRTIAATTWAEYKQYFEKDAALSRRFQVVKVEEPTEAVAIDMLRGMIPVMAQHFNLQIDDEAIIAAVHASHRYISGRQLPDKAISVLDEDYESLTGNDELQNFEQLLQATSRSVQLQNYQQVLDIQKHWQQLKITLDDLLGLDAPSFSVIDEQVDSIIAQIKRLYKVEQIAHQNNENLLQPKESAIQLGYTDKVSAVAQTQFRLQPQNHPANISEYCDGSVPGRGKFLQIREFLPRLQLTRCKVADLWFFHLRAQPIYSVQNASLPDVAQRSSHLDPAKDHLEF